MISINNKKNVRITFRKTLSGHSLSYYFVLYSTVIKLVFVMAGLIEFK